MVAKGTCTTHQRRRRAPGSLTPDQGLIARRDPDRVPAMTPSAGLSLKPQHFDEALDRAAEGLWFEVHPENYMVDGGPRLAWLERIRARHPLSLHGVGAVARRRRRPRRAPPRAAGRAVRALRAGARSPSTSRGRRGAASITRPAAVAAHARGARPRWSRNVGRMQDALGRSIAIENPSHYLRFDAHEYDEIEFLAELARRSGCGLLLDVNNVYVGARNLGYDAARRTSTACRASWSREIHLAGHSRRPGAGRRAADRLARRAGRAGSLGALRAADRAHRADARR